MKKEEIEKNLIPADWKWQTELEKELYSKDYNFTVEQVVNSCYFKGKYCALHDAKYLKRPVESIDQVLVQSCLWEQAKSTHSEKDFFKFAKAYNTEC